MNPKQTGGYLFLFVAFLSMCLQLPQDIHTHFTFGFFGSETNLPDPDCNAIAPKLRNCKNLNPNCSDIEYILGPQSADPGGVNTRRFDKIGTLLDCTSNTGGTKAKCPDRDPYQESKEKCLPKFVEES